MFCPNCGKSIQENASFCGECGFKFEKTEEKFNEEQEKKINIINEAKSLEKQTLPKPKKNKDDSAKKVVIVLLTLIIICSAALIVILLKQQGKLDNIGNNNSDTVQENLNVDEFGYEIYHSENDECSESLTQDEIYKMNLFLSIFAEAQFPLNGGDAISDENMLDYAAVHCLINEGEKVYAVGNNNYSMSGSLIKSKINDVLGDNDINIQNTDIINYNSTDDIVTVNVDVVNQKASKVNIGYKQFDSVAAVDKVYNLQSDTMLVYFDIYKCEAREITGGDYNSLSKNIDTGDFEKTGTGRAVLAFNADGYILKNYNVKWN